MNYDKILLKILITSKDRINSSIMKKIIYDEYPNVKNYLENRYNDSESLQESLNRIKYHINDRPICKVCGNKVKYIGKNIFREFCSYKCLGIGTNNKRKQTNIKRYHQTTPLKNKKIKEKIKETCLKKYGQTTPLKNEEIKEKIKETCLKKYGTKNVFGSNIIKEKIKNTLINKYGVNNPWKSNKIQEKRKNTMIKKYGYQYTFQRPDIKKIFEFNNSENKRLNTKRKNHTFNTSKPEEELYLYIKEKFPLVERQYNKDKRYPWCCDFYIPELDLFLELNGTWTHGKHPFAPTSYYDNLILREWKEKSKEHPYYLNAINTWINRDVEKRKCAKKNNLNFKEVWTLEEGKKFIDELYYANTESTTTTNRPIYL